MTKNIVIIGAGISGMACAYLLVGHGYHITICAKEFSPNITSNKAAAFWFPYHIRNDKRGINWCHASYYYYKSLAKQPATGISMRQLKKVLRTGIAEEEPVWIEFMPENTCRLNSNGEFNPGIAKVYDVTVPLIETQIFLPWLQLYLQNNGVVFLKREIKDLYDLSKQYSVVINCSALGAKKLCNDEFLIPVKGQVALLKPIPGNRIYLDNEKLLYIVPRKDSVIVGGTYEENTETEFTEPTTIKRILENAYEVLPLLRKQELIGSWAGIRPYRPEVRVEKEPATNIIHNYGHGGSGFTLAFGCAETVRNMIEG